MASDVEGQDEERRCARLRLSRLWQWQVAGQAAGPGAGPAPVLLVLGSALLLPSPGPACSQASLGAPLQQLLGCWIQQGGCRAAVRAHQAAGPAQALRGCRWREWVDERLVKVVTVNIYRNWSESFQTFDYITETGKFGVVERQAARIVGAVMMWAIAGARCLGDPPQRQACVRQAWCTLPALPGPPRARAWC